MTKTNIKMYHKHWKKRNKIKHIKEETTAIDKSKAINFDKRRNSKEIKEAKMKKDMNSK